MKNSIFFKIFSAFLLIIILISLALFVFYFETIKAHYIHFLKTDMEKLAVSLKPRITDYIEESDFARADSFVKAISDQVNTRITVVRLDGLVLADSEEDPGSMDNHSTRPEIMQAYKGNTGSSLRYSKTLDQSMLYVAVPIYVKDELFGVVRVSLFLTQINNLLFDLKKKVTILTIIVLIFSLLIAFVLSRSFSRPINKLSEASREVASGNFDVKVYVKKKGELKQLAESFNNMVARIKKLIAQLSRQKESLNTIISSINEGLLVLDQEGRVLLYNESFEKITRTSDMEDKLYWEVLRNSELNQVIKQIRKVRDDINQEIEIGNRHYICSGSYLERSEEIVLTLHNITEIRRTEKIKRDFILNMSHELRTPLTAIKGFMETVKDDVDEQNRRYVAIVLKHTERLQSLVDDLLSLAKLEDRGATLEIQEVGLQQILEDLIQIYDKQAKEKGLYIRTEFGEELPMIKADSFKLEQMFINLIENAIRYTEAGGLTISAWQEGNKVVIKVKDTGIGIPGEDTARIFERFYVVDKSRSRKAGGTGLGLSIVKHIVLLHDGEIEVESTVGAGTVFTISLPFTG